MERKMFLMPAQLAITSCYCHRGLADALDRDRPCPRAFSCCRRRVTESGLRCGLFRPALPGCVEDPETALPAPSLSEGLAPVSRCPTLGFSSPTSLNLRGRGCSKSP